MTIEEKRKYARLALRIDDGYFGNFKLDNNEQLVGPIVNISAGGTLICLEEALPAHGIIRLVIKPPVRTPLEITGEVVRSRIYCANDLDVPRGIAVRFIIISEKDRQFLSFTVFDLLQERFPSPGPKQESV